MTELGVHLRQGNGIAWNEAEAMQWFEKAAAQGDVQAMTAAGLGLDKGLGGGPQDYAARRALLRAGRAARRRLCRAESRLAVRARLGRATRMRSRRKLTTPQASRDRNPQVAAIGARNITAACRSTARRSARSARAALHGELFGRKIVGFLGSSGGGRARGRCYFRDDTAIPANLRVLIPRPRRQVSPPMDQTWSDHALDRMAQGCFWSMDTTGFGGSCQH